MSFSRDDEAGAALQEESHGKGGDPVTPGEVDLVVGREEEVGLCEAEGHHDPQGGKSLEVSLETTHLPIQCLSHFPGIRVSLQH